MSRNRNRNAADFDSDGEIFGCIPSRFVKNVGISEVFGFLVLLWVSAIALHISYNVHVGMKHSGIQIEKQSRFHKACNENEVVRERSWDACETAKIEKDLSSALMTVNYVLHNTSVCIVSSCYDIFTDVAGRLGWLLIGIGVVASLFLCIILKNNIRFDAQMRANQIDRPREILLLDSEENINRRGNRQASRED